MKAAIGCGGALVAVVLLAGHVAAQGVESSAKGFVVKQCNEDVLTLALDPKPLEQFVGSEFSLRLVKGKARVLVVVQDCPTFWMDGEEVGPTQEIHEWVAIEAASDIRPAPGAQRTLPTSTWFALFDGSNNARHRKLRAASGAPTFPVENLSLESPGPTLRGRADVGSGLSYSWEAQAAPPFARLVTVNHDVYARDSGGKIVFNRIQALLNVFAWASPGTLKVVGATNPKRLIGPGTYTITVNTFRPVWVRVSLGEASPK